MARRIRSNPSAFGVDLEDALITGSGIFVSQLANNAIATPILNMVAPGILSQGAPAKIADAVTTLLSAVFIAGEGGKLLFGDRIGGEMRNGGVALAGAKALTAVIPGLSLNPQVPAVQVPGLGGKPASVAAPAQLGGSTAGSGGTQIAGTGAAPVSMLPATLAASVTPGYGKVASQLDVGL